MKRSTRQSPGSSKTGASMDPSTPEVPNTSENPRVFTNHPRNCWALDTLVSEVEAADPRVTRTFDNPDASNACLDVEFGGCSEDMIRALTIAVANDPRVEVTMHGGEHYADKFYVSFYGHALTKDSREPFGVGDALAVLIDDETGEGVEA